MPRAAITNLEIHQTLHGYKDGHALLAASRRLPGEADRMMLVISDMSGPTIYHNFEKYFTAYNLPSITSLAFAKTWYAPEMKRPGCVWTHTFLIAYSDVSRVPSLTLLTPYFVRPKKGCDYDDYNATLHIHINNERRSSRVLMPKDNITEILDQLYSRPYQPLFIQADTPEQYTEAIFAVWDQQWPRLRRSFSFCTGSLSNRQINNAAVDVQIIPYGISEGLKREVPNATFIDPMDTATRLHSDWVALAVDDLIEGRNESFRRFIWHFGADLPEERAAFSKLAGIFKVIDSVNKGTRSISELIEIISEHFPSASLGVRLKAEVLRAEENAEWISGEITEYDLLKEFASTPYFDSFDGATLNLRYRAQALWRVATSAEGKNLIYSLLEQDLNALGEDIIRGIAEVLSDDEVEYLAINCPHAAIVLAKINPCLFECPRLWRSFTDTMELLDTVASYAAQMSVETVERVVTAILESNIREDAERTINIFGKYAIDVALNWMNNTDRPTGQAISEWRTSLISRPTIYVEWLNSVNIVTYPVITLIPSILHPHSDLVHDTDNSIWIKIIDVVASQQDSYDKVKIMAFILALGFDNAHTDSVMFVTKSFQVVHDAAERNELFYESWGMLKDSVPSISYWRDWDKCERLRRGLIERFIEYKWPADLFLKCFESRDTLLRTLESSYWSYWKSSHREFLEKVRRVMNS